MKIVVEIKGSISKETLTNACLSYLKHQEVREVIFNADKKVQDQVR